MVVDPLLTATADARLESDQFYSGLGCSVAGAGDVNGDGYADVIVGAPRYEDGDEFTILVKVKAADRLSPEEILDLSVTTCADALYPRFIHESGMQRLGVSP